MSRDKYNLLDEWLKNMSNDHISCLTDYDADQRAEYLAADDTTMHECVEMNLIDDDGNLTAIGDLIVLEVENQLPR